MWKHFVAIGDSLTVGIGDEVENVPLKSWVEHFAELHKPHLTYTNLAKRGLVVKEIRSSQLEKAIELHPDLVSLIAGANDVLKGRWNSIEYKNDMEYMVENLSRLGAKIIIGNLPDFSNRLPLPTEQKKVLKSQLLEANEMIQSLSNKYQLVHIDFWNHPMANDLKLLSKDLIHPNSIGYQEIAEMVFKHLY